MAQDPCKGKPQALPVYTWPDMGGVNPLLFKEVYHKFFETVTGKPCKKPDIRISDLLRCKFIFNANGTLGFNFDRIT